MFRQIQTWKSSQSALIIILFALAFCVYLNTYQNQFSADDREILLNDHRLRSLHSLPSLFTQDYWMKANTNLYRPLPLLSFAINYYVSGTAPWSYHLVNQLLHCLNVVLLYIFLGNFYRKQPGLRFLASAVFAVHPAATESVDYIVGRAELLSFAFTLSAFQLYIQRGRGALYRCGSVALFFLGMLSKESAMMLPVFLLLYHVYFEKNDHRAFLRTLTGYGAALLLFSGLRYAVLGSFGPRETEQAFYGIPWSSTAYTMAKAIAYYWKIVFWPIGLQMNYDLNDIPVVSSLFDGWVMFSLAFLASILTTAILFFKTRPETSFFMLWPFVAFFPVMNIIVPTGVVLAIRLMYLPMVGYCVLTAELFFLLRPLLDKVWPPDNKIKSAAIFSAVVALLLLLLSVMTLARNADWLTTETLFKKELALSPNSISAMKSLATVLPPDESEILLKRLLELEPFNADALSLLGRIFEEKKDTASAEALYRRSLLGDPNELTLRKLGVLLSDTGRLDEAEEQFRMAIRMKPLWADVYEDLAVVLSRKGNMQGAFEASQKALRLNPDSAITYNLIGNYYKVSNAFDKAVGAFQKAVELSPMMYEARYNLAEAYEKVDRRMALDAWQQYVRVAEDAPSEAAWVMKARERIAYLSQLDYTQ